MILETSPCLSKEFVRLVKFSEMTLRDKLSPLTNLMSGASERAGKLTTTVSSSMSQSIGFAKECSQPVLLTLTRATEEVRSRLKGGTDRPLVEVPDLTIASQDVLLAYFGAMISLASADDHLDKDELVLLLDAFEVGVLEPESFDRLKGFLVEPPDFFACLSLVGEQDELLRFGLAFQLVELAFADNVIQPEEKAALEQASEILGVTQAQMDAILAFVKEARRLELRGKDDKVAGECLKRAAGGLASVGVPISAVYFSGSVIGLSAAGITSGLAALGLGFGMVPGIAAAVLLGTGTYLGLGRVLDFGGQKQRQLENAEAERRAQLVIRHLQEALAALAERILLLQASAETAERNRLELEALKVRMQAFQSIIARKQLALGSE